MRNGSSLYASHQETAQGQTVKHSQTSLAEPVRKAALFSLSPPPPFFPYTLTPQSVSAFSGAFSGNELRPTMESASLLLSQLFPLLFHHLFCLTGLRTIPPSSPICKQLSSSRSARLFHPSLLPPESSHLLHFPFSQKKKKKSSSNRCLTDPSHPFLLLPWELQQKGEKESP